MVWLTSSRLRGRCQVLGLVVPACVRAIYSRVPTSTSTSVPTSSMSAQQNTPTCHRCEPNSPYVFSRCFGNSCPDTRGTVPACDWRLSNHQPCRRKTCGMSTQRSRRLSVPALRIVRAALEYKMPTSRPRSLGKACRSLSFHLLPSG
jgi:hypothetical protein